MDTLCIADKAIEDDGRSNASAQGTHHFCARHFCIRPCEEPDDLSRVSAERLHFINTAMLARVYQRSEDFDNADSQGGETLDKWCIMHEFRCMGAVDFGRKTKEVCRQTQCIADEKSIPVAFMATVDPSGG